MPLIEGKSKKSFEKNIRTEIKAGKNPKQAVAIAYAVKRRNMAKGGGLYANIHAKRERIEAGSGERMRKPGSEGAPTAKAFKESEKTAKLAQGGEVKKHMTQKESVQCEKCGHHMAMGGNATMAEGGEAHCAHGGPEHCAAGCYAEGGKVNLKPGALMALDMLKKGKTPALMLAEESPQAKLLSGKPLKYSSGGEIQNMKLHPHSAPPMDAKLRKDVNTMKAPGSSLTEVGKLAHGGSVVEEIMKKRMARGGFVEAEEDNEPAFERDIDFSNTHYIEDEEHDAEDNPSDDDHSLVGQIMSEREEKKKRMGR